MSHSVLENAILRWRGLKCGGCRRPQNPIPIEVWLYKGQLAFGPGQDDKALASKTALIMSVTALTKQEASLKMRRGSSHAGG